MRRIRQITECVLFVMVSMMLCACPNDVEEVKPDTDKKEDIEIIEDEKEDGKDVEVQKPSVSLDYSFRCNHELLEFVTPVITYTDKDGTHEVVLNEELMTTEEYLFVHKTEDGKTIYSVEERDENGEVPAPWILDEVLLYSSYVAIVQLDSVGLENTCSVTYQLKSDYTIDSTRTYDLSRSLGCVKGTASVVSGGLNITMYTGSPTSFGGKTLWKAEEVDAYLDILSKTTDSETIIVSENGRISKKQN